MTTKFKLSQSLIKAYFDYHVGKFCGLLLEQRYILRNPKAQSEPSDAMNAGIYFEYLCTGSLPKSGIVPTPEKTAKGFYTAPFDRAQKAAVLYQKMIRHYGIKILKTGLTLSTDDLDGTLDILAECNGEKVIIDLKYSGLIDDKWNEFGFDTESLNLKDTLCIQPVHYKLLAKLCLGVEDIPFYFWVFDATKEGYAKVIRLDVGEDKAQSHLVMLDNVREKIETTMHNGFKPIASMKNCNKCPLFDECPSRAEFPLIEVVTY